MIDRDERQTRTGKLTFEVNEDWRRTRDLAGGLRLTLGDVTAVLPYPAHGLGGHELVVSPDETYLALFLFSGQSEQGWELFELPSLEHLGGLPYRGGEGGPPRFSADSRWLAMLVNINPQVRGTDETFEDVHDPDIDDVILVDWAALYLQQVPSGAIVKHHIGTHVPRSFDVEEITFEWRTYDELGRPAFAFTDGSTMTLQMPWGELVSVNLPLDGPITTPPPRACRQE